MQGVGVLEERWFCLWTGGTVLFATFCLAQVLAQPNPRSKVLMLEELPLAVIATQPSSLGDWQSDEPVLVSGKQTLTVVFSRPVVRLQGDPHSQYNDTQAVFSFEPEIPGNFTWSSSFTVHFSPKLKWPPENKLKLEWNPAISSLDGANLLRDAETDRIVEVITPNLTLSLQFVVSDHSKQSSDGGWDANVGTPADVLPEVPPNARIFLKFSHPVSLKALRDHFQVYEDKQPVDLGLQVLTCKMDQHIPSPGIQNIDYAEQETSCIIVTLAKSKPGARFFLVLGAGTKLSNNSGLLKEELSVSFGGLRSFTIPFVEQPSMGSFNISHRGLIMWLPHGLSKDTTIIDLKRQVSIVTNRTGQEVNFDLSLKGSSICRLLASFSPGESYRIKVASSPHVLDGYNQPLQEASLLLATDAIEPMFEPLRPRAQKVSIYEESMDWGQNIVAFYNGGNMSESITSCSGKNIIRAWIISTDVDLRQPLSILQSSTGTNSLESVLGNNVVAELKPPSMNDADMISANISENIKEFGVLATEFCRSGTFTSHLLIETSIQVAIVAWGSSNALVWITSMENGNAIGGATVRFFNSGAEGFQSEPLGVGNFTEVEKGQTDKNGRWMMSDFSDDMHVSVEYKGKLLYIPDVKHVVPQTKKTIYDVFMLDRAVLRPGETLLIHGYIMKLEEISFQPLATLVTPQLTISPPLSVESGDSRYPLTVTENGGFTISIPIPVDASPSVYTVQFEAAEVLGSFEQFRVVHNWPVKPIIKLDAPEWVYSSSKVMITAVLRSSIDVAIVGAQLNISHVIVGPPHIPEKNIHAASEIMVTDEEGTVKSVIDLSSLHTSPAPGSILISTASWNREVEDLLEDRKISRLEVADLVLRMHRTVETNMPGQKFSVRVSATTLKGTPVSALTSVRLKKSTTLRAVARITDSPIGGVTVSNCSAKTDDLEYNCRFALPSMGRFLLEVCSEAAERICRSEPLGWTRDEWEKKPLNSHLKIGLVSLSPQPHSIQNQFKFGLESPYKNSSALLTWGSSIKVKHKIIKLQDDTLSKFSLQLGEECLGNCAISAVVAVPRQSSLSELVKDEVPTSKLFDPLMPHLATVDLNIQVAQNRSSVVELTIPELGCCNAAAPGKNLSLSIAAGQDDSETQMDVTVVVSRRHPSHEGCPPDLAARFNLDMSLGFTKTVSSDYLIAPQTERVLAMSFLDRINVDPWAATYADEFGMNVDSKIVDLSLEEYLTMIEAPITVIPSWLVDEDQFQGSQHSSESGVEAPSLEIGFWTTREYNLSEVANGRMHTSLLFTFSMDVKRPYSFLAPEHPGDYLINAYTTSSGAGGEGMRFGSAQLILSVQDPYSFNVTAPRFVRVNDSFDLLVQMSSLQSTSLKVTIKKNSAKIFDLDGNSNKEIESNSTQIQIKVHALGLGSGALTISAGGVKEEIMIDVLGKQDSVGYLRVSRVSAVDSSDFLPPIMELASVPLVDEQVSIHLGVGELPNFMSFLTDFHLRNHKKQCPLSADYLLSLVILHVVGMDYKIGDLDPSILDNTTLKAVASSLDVTFALDTLESMTANTLGLRSVAFCQGSSESSLPKLAMNGKAAALISLLDVFPITTATMGEQYSRLVALVSTWKEALSRSVVTELGIEDGSPDPETLAVVRAGLGSEFRGDNSALEKQLGKIISQNLLELDIDSQAYYILAQDSNDLFDQRKVTRNWAVIYQQGTSLGYIPSVHNPNAPTSYLGNVLALVVLLRSGLTQANMVHGLANYVRSPPLGQDGLHELLDIDRAAAMIALRLYDIQFPSPKFPDLTAVLHNSVKGDFSSFDTRLMSVRVSGEKGILGSKTLIEIAGEGELSVAALSTVIPQEPYPNPLFQGVFLERSLHSTGVHVKRTSTMALGSVVTIVLQVTVPVDSEDVMINVLMPGGLEALQSESGSSQSMVFCMGKDLDLEVLNCYTQETRLSSVAFEFDTLSKGTHEVRFSALAARVGDFFFPPSKVIVRAEPTRVGFSNGGIVHICSRGVEGCGFAAIADNELPIACADNCNGNGACDLKKGECLCRFGFQSDNCGAFYL